VLAADTNPSSWLSQLTTHVLSIVRQPSPVTFNSMGVPTGPDAGVSANVWVTLMALCATALPSMRAITSWTPP
jgi:hypothetical protein